MSAGSGSRVPIGPVALLAGLALLAVPGAAAQAAPTVVTGQPTEVTRTSARLNGTVNPNGRPARYFFSLGVGADRISHDAGAGTAPVAVGTLLTGLLPGTEYSYSLHAVDADGNRADGELVRFKTRSPPCRVPRLKGAYLVTASSKLALAGCALGRVRYRHLGRGIQRIINRLSARVVSQRPRPGRLVAHGTKVSLVLEPRR